MWPFLTAQVKTSPRNTIPIGNDCIVQGDWKLILGKTSPNFWQGPTFPNSSSIDFEDDTLGDVHYLFNVVEDHTEQNNVYDEHPDLVATMTDALKTLKPSFFQNKDKFDNDCPEGTKNCACWMAENQYGGFMGPFALTDMIKTSLV